MSEYPGQVNSSFAARGSAGTAGGLQFRDWETNERFYLETIEAYAPEVQIYQAKSIVPVEEGWDSLILDVAGCSPVGPDPGSEMIFRFPRFPKIRDAYRKEAALLTELGRLLPAPLPVFEHLHLDDPDPYRCFVAYRKLPGAPMRREDLFQADGMGARCTPLVDQLAGFLRTLHSIPLDVAYNVLGIPQPDPVAFHSAQVWRQRYLDLYTWVRQAVFPLLNRDQVARSRELWEPHLAAAENFYFQPVLIHADLGPEHILVDQMTGHLSGIIDWEDAQIGDAALDFAGLASLDTPAALDDLIELYFGKTGFQSGDPSLLKRSTWYRAIAPFYQVQYGLQVEASNHLKEGLQSI